MLDAKSASMIAFGQDISVQRIANRILDKAEMGEHEMCLKFSISLEMVTTLLDLGYGVTVDRKAENTYINW